MTTLKIEIEPLGDSFRLLLDGGQAGLYDTQDGAKAGARRFISSHERIKWIPQEGGRLLAHVSHKRTR